MASIYVELGNGRKALLWTDRWLQGRSISELAPCLCNAIGSRIKKQRTVAQALPGDNWTRDISGALTVQVLLEYLHIWELTRGIQVQVNQNDRICWMWTSDMIFSTSSAYRSFFMGQHPTEGAKLLQKARAPPKCKFFIWLVLHDRCWMADRHKRHGLQDDDTCSLCNQLPETIDHLLLVCPFSREVWFRALCFMHWEATSPTVQAYTLADWWYGARKRISKDDRKCFDSLVVLLCWLLWKERNNRTFNCRVRTVNDFLSCVANEVVSWYQAGYKHLVLVVGALGRLTCRLTITV